MKKKLVIVSIFLLLLGITACGESDEKNSSAKSDAVYHNVTVSVIQSVAIPGGNYAPLENASIPAAKMKNGKFNLRYDFTVNADEDEKNAVISMTIIFPGDISVTELTSSGVAAKNSNQSRYYIAQHKNGTGSLEFEVEIPSEHYDEVLPVDFIFHYYHLTLTHNDRSILGTVVGVASGVVAGVLTGSPSTGVAVGAGTAAALGGGSVVADILETKTLEELEGVTPKYMRESQKRFAISVRN